MLVGPKRATRNVHVQHLQRELRSRHSFSGLYDMQRATARNVQRALLCVRARADALRATLSTLEYPLLTPLCARVTL